MTLLIRNSGKCHSLDYGEVNMTGMRIAVHSIQMYHGMGLSQILWVVHHALSLHIKLVCS